MCLCDSYTARVLESSIRFNSRNPTQVDCCNVVQHNARARAHILERDPRGPLSLLLLFNTTSAHRRGAWQNLP